MDAGASEQIMYFGRDVAFLKYCLSYSLFKLHSGFQSRSEENTIRNTAGRFDNHVYPACFSADSAGRQRAPGAHSGKGGCQPALPNPKIILVGYPVT